MLPKHNSQAMTESVQADSLGNSNPLQSRTNVTLQDHVRRQRLRPILCDGRENIVGVGPVESDRLRHSFNSSTTSSGKWYRLP